MWFSPHVLGTNIQVSIKNKKGAGGVPADPESAGLGLNPGVFGLFSADLDVWGQVWASN